MPPYSAHRPLPGNSENCGMVLLTFPDSLFGTGERPLVFYLAMEEYVAANIDKYSAGGESPVECFFLWKTPPTVIIGRNQDVEAEVNLPFCRKNGITVVRRKSGGGCVYSDRGNLMYSVISPVTDVEKSFTPTLEKVAGALRNLGIDASVTGRNDILVDGRKVSGSAFFKHPKAGIVHGTLLFNSDFDTLEKAITPSKEKLSSKGISSVRQRVANLSEYYYGGDIDAFAAAFARELKTSDRRISPEELSKIHETDLLIF